MSIKFILFLVIMVLLFPGFFAALIEGIATAIFMVVVGCVIIMVINAACGGTTEKSEYATW